MIIYNCSKGTEHIVKPKWKGKVNEMNNIFGITVEQMINDRGNGAINQFVIRDEENSRLAFQSYNSIIAVVDYHEDTITIFPDWDYSTTTGKHRNIFFRDYAHISALATKKGIEKALADGWCGERWQIKTAS